MEVITGKTSVTAAAEEAGNHQKRLPLPGGQFGRLRR